MKNVGPTGRTAVPATGALRHLIAQLIDVRAVLTAFGAAFALLAALMCYFERAQFFCKGTTLLEAIGQAAYLSAITALTVGYGDVYPKTPWGRLTAVLLGLLGIVFTGVIVAATINALNDAHNEARNKGGK